MPAIALYERGAQPVRRDRYLGHAHARRVMDRIQNCRRGRDQRLLANSFRAIWPERRGILDQNLNFIGGTSAVGMR